jgi:osmotically-inducible protein OsmY
MHLRTLVKGAALGAAAAYLMDPVAGGGRRARLRDRIGAIVRRGEERAGDLRRHASNVVEGTVHQATATDAGRAMDDATVADRIRSEVLGTPAATGVVVNVEDGVAYLRGEVTDDDAAADLVGRARGVSGVLQVENLLHLPGSDAPNKRAARSASERTAS